MRILLVSVVEHPTAGGVDTYINSVRKVLGEQGHNIDLLCLSHIDQLPPSSIQKIGIYRQMLLQKYVHILPLLKIEFEVQKYIHKELLQYFDLSDYDIIHSQSGITSKAIAETWPDKPLVGTIHGCHYTEAIANGWVGNLEQAEYFKIYDEYAVDCPDQIIRVSHYMNPGMYAVPQDKDNVIHNAVDTSRFMPASKDGNSTRIITSGMLVPNKGYDIFLNALILLKERLNNFKVEVVMLGDGPELSRYQEFASAHNLNISFKGHLLQDEVIKELQQSHILIQPSRMESFGLSITEAMSCGCVPICSNVGGIPDQVKHEYNGLLFEPNDIKGLASAIELLLDSREEMKVLAVRSRELVESHFSLTSFASKLMEVYKKTIEAKSEVRLTTSK